MTSKFVDNLYKELAQETPFENIFFSPFNIMMSMSMVLYGAEGQSKAQLLKALGFPSDCDVETVLNHQKKRSEVLSHTEGECVELNIANKMYPQISYPICVKFIEILKEALQCNVERLDFHNKPEHSRQVINEWVESETGNEIKNLIPTGKIQSDTRLILVNAIYFKGKWIEHFFDKKKTKIENFYCLDKSVNKVGMMMSYHMLFYNRDKDLKVGCLRIPYEGNRRNFSMCIFLPDSRYGLAKVEKSLTLDTMNKMLDTAHREMVNLKLPKFKLEYQNMLVDTLKSLGIEDIFELGKADLSGITEAEDLFVSDVAHMAVIEVNEEGTVAAAAKHSICGGGAPTPVNFTCNHPFIFIIRHDWSEEVLFYGKVAMLGQ